jgi:twitching motility protein PilT
MMTLQQLFAETVRLKASDLHLIVGYPPMLRIDGKLAPLDGTTPLSSADTQQLVYEVVQGDRKELFLSNKEIDFSLGTEGGRFRANIYYQKGTVAADFRHIPNIIRSIDELNLPQICHEFTKLRQGLVLVTGPTGHGKSTTLAAMIQKINETKAHHIITIEDPIEYVYAKGLSIVSQREMHEDSHSWNVALRSVLREDPDVVLIGEMRDFETIAAAITIAETGHLVFATLHTNSAAQTIDRIVDVFPQSQQSQVRMQLASVIEGVLSLRLIPAVGGGRTAVAEIMTGTPAVRTTIRDGKSHLIDNIIQTSAELGMETLETALAKAVKSGKISVETATSYAVRPEELGRILKT